MNKKILVLPIIGSFLLSGCKLNLFGKTIYLFEDPPEKKQNTDIIDGGGDPQDQGKEVVSISADPKAPFYLKVGEPRNISVSPSPSEGVDPEKKTFSWEKNNDNLILTVNDTNTAKATVTGVTQGNTTIVVKNDYNPSLTKTFDVKVIDFNSENEYLWEYSTRTPFGYNSSDAKKGLAEGTATLNGMDWEFKRQHTAHPTQNVVVESEAVVNATLEHAPLLESSVKGSIGTIEFADDGKGTISGTGVSGSINYETGALSLTFSEAQTGTIAISYDFIEGYITSLDTSSGGVTFGKSGDPETHIHFKAHNERIVEKVIIEAASANSLGKMSVKVGNTIYMEDRTLPDDYYEGVQTLIAYSSELAGGDISIDIETPEMDNNAAAVNPNYRKPGAFLLKSIWIKYVEETYVGIDFAQDSKHKIDYIEGEEFSWEGMKLDKISERGYRVPVNMTDASSGDTPKLTQTGFDSETASHAAQSVELSLKVGEETFTKSFDVHVRSASWVPEKLEIKGSLDDQTLVAGDVVDYSKLSIDVVYSEESNDIRVAPFKESSEFTFKYGDNKDPFVANVGMEAGYTITVTGLYNSGASEVSTTFSVAANKIQVTASIFDRIDYERSSTLKEITDAGLKGESNSGPLSYTSGQNNRIRLDFNKVYKDTTSKGGRELPTTNSEFRLTALDTNLSIKEIQITFALKSKSDNKFRLFSSIYGGDIYGSELAQANDQYLEFASFEEHTNSLRLLPQLNSSGGLLVTNVYIQSILVRYEELPHVEYTISKGDTIPSKMNYVEGEVFNPTGLTVTLNETLSENSYNITSFMKWYDGSTYESNPQETLLPESTYVIGEFHGKTIQVDITSVEPRTISISKVTSVDQITGDGKYYLACPTYQAILKANSANDTIFTGNGCYKDTQLEFGDSMELNVSLEEEYLTITPLTNGKFTIQSRHGYFSIKSGGGYTCSNTAANYRDFEITEDNGELTFMIFRNDGTEQEPSGPKYYLGSTVYQSKPMIKMYTEDQARQNVVLYKVVS